MMVWSHMFRGAAEGVINSFLRAAKSCTPSLRNRFLCEMVPTSSSALGHMVRNHIFWPSGGEGVCPFNPVPLEVFTTKENIIHTNGPSHRWGFELRPPRLAHQDYSIYFTNSLAESGLKSVSELKPDLGVASTFCPECSAPHIVLT